MLLVVHMCVCINHRLNTKNASLVGGILRSSCAGDGYRSICHYIITTARRRETIRGGAHGRVKSERNRNYLCMTRIRVTLKPQGPPMGRAPPKGASYMSLLCRRLFSKSFFAETSFAGGSFIGAKPTPSAHRPLRCSPSKSKHNSN